MNIQEAKETIEKALRAYFARDEAGNLLVPLRQQRPILLIGPPGIGKTAIMEQIAEECGACCLHDDTPYASECHGPSGDLHTWNRRENGTYNGIHDERDHRLDL